MRMDYLEHKISKEELPKIFKNHFDRSGFIHEYPYFGDDGNNEYYKKFIADNISSRKFKVQEDAIELSLVINNYEASYLAIISKIIYSKRTYWIKLLCMDWLAVFVDEIPDNTFIDLNLYALKNANEFLKLQSTLNLLLLSNDPELYERLLKLLNETKDPAIFYRLANSLNDRSGPSLTKEIIEKFIHSVNTSHIPGKGQKIEIIKILSKLRK